MSVGVVGRGLCGSRVSWAVGARRERACHLPVNCSVGVQEELDEGEVASVRREV